MSEKSNPCSADVTGQACCQELQAIKPGNVGYHADGHGMRVDQFEVSAQVVSTGLI